MWINFLLDLGGMLSSNERRRHILAQNDIQFLSTQCYGKILPHALRYRIVVGARVHLFRQLAALQNWRPYRLPDMYLEVGFPVVSFFFRRDLGSQTPSLACSSA